MKLKDKVCLVTGATSGMGKAIAKIYAKEGAKIIFNGRDRSRGDLLAKEIMAAGNEQVYFLPGDISLPETNKELVDLAIEKFNRLDVVVANAGVLGLGNVIEISLEDWHKTINTNFNSLFYMAKYSIPHLLKTKGTIIANASIAAFKNFPNHPAYCASKAGTVSLVKQLALDFGPDIRVNAMCPGPVDTPLIWDSAKAFDNPSNAVEAAGKTTPLKRLGQPDDVAKLALF